MEFLLCTTKVGGHHALALDRTKLLIKRKLYTEAKSIPLLAPGEMWLLVERILCASRP